jgi:hypothetical protein
MHASTDARLLRFLDGINLSFQMLNHAHDHLYATCSKLKGNPKMLPVAFWLAWSFVDALNRIRELAQAVPGLGSKTPELATFLEVTEIAVTYRNYIQHLRQELSKRNSNEVPVWGVLSWVDPSDSTIAHIALAGAAVGNTKYPSCVFDTQTGKWVSRVTLCIQETAFNFDPIYDSCVGFSEYILPWITKTYTPGITTLDELPIYSVKFQLGQSANPSAVA